MEPTILMKKQIKNASISQGNQKLISDSNISTEHKLKSCLGEDKLLFSGQPLAHTLSTNIRKKNNVIKTYESLFYYEPD